jgi:hypothetical protein
MGEEKFEQTALVKAVQGAIAEQPQEPSGDLRVVTPGGVFQVRWDENASASALGQLAFFGEFLEVSGLFDRWVKSCPLEYTSPNAPEVRDVLGTWLLSILDGQRRYAHINGLRGDAVAPQILDMTRIISDESLRRALKALAPSVGKSATEEQRRNAQAQLDKSTAWMDTALRESTFDALGTDWILDCDTTVKLLFGHQDGAEIGYNPSKPGRPSHNIHTYWIANLRLVLDAEVKGGKTQPAKYSLPGLMRLLLALPPEKRPELVRGDSAFGNDPVMTELESIGQMYLTKLRQTAGVKRLIERNWSRQDWQDVGQGSEAVEAQLKLAGWSHARRVVVVRSPPKTKPAAAQSVTGKKAKRQKDLDLEDAAEALKRWDYAVLVTNSSFELKAIGQLYRDRADCENGFDELKNQWGWGGYTTQDLERCNLCARAVALIYNWWSWYVRLAHPATRLEAITSRPLLLAGVARLTEHAGQSRLLLTLTHTAGDLIKSMVTNVRKGLDSILATAPQLTKRERWAALVRYIVEKIIATKPKNYVQPTLMQSKFSQPLIAAAG